MLGGLGSAFGSTGASGGTEAEFPGGHMKPRTVISSIMRARSGLTGRWERLESIGGSSREPKVADLRCSGMDDPIVTPSRSPPHPWRTGGVAPLPRERVRSMPNPDTR